MPRQQNLVAGSTDDANKLRRRELCARLLAGALLGPWLLWPERLRAESDSLVDEDEPLAMKLGYRHEAGSVDTVSFPKRAGEQGARQFCDNCALFAGEPGDADAPCSIFQNRRVKGRGWCNAWVSRP